MKKFLILAVAIIISLAASAQVEKGFRMGVNANVGMSNVTDRDASLKISYGIGWVAEYNFTESSFISSGINLNMLGAKNMLNGAISGTLNVAYLQVPIHIGYRFNIANATSLFVQAGPTIGVGLFGSDIKDSDEQFNYFDVAKRFDLGVGGRIGVEFSKVLVSAGADYGVLKVFDGGAHNINFNLGITYMF